ncbi:hypothetical protein VRRI112168_07075 [Vreelandella rituensis]|uniref:Uncharacterized protein n=2 Tax=Vreelandella rituensis TaxID=2282306 RepID=A0A368U4S7_9GAMM|nr:hypothetical protein [Halomonas rituensis]RCV92140.1 hypothetical protein DU506_09045 [Halomonas rituensis]
MLPVPLLVLVVFVIAASQVTVASPSGMLFCWLRLNQKDLAKEPGYHCIDIRIIWLIDSICSSGPLDLSSEVQKIEVEKMLENDIA